MRVSPSLQQQCASVSHVQPPNSPAVTLPAPGTRSLMASTTSPALGSRAACGVPCVSTEHARRTALGALLLPRTRLQLAEQKRAALCSDLKRALPVRPARASGVALTERLHTRPRPRLGVTPSTLPSTCTSPKASWPCKRRGVSARAAWCRSLRVLYAAQLHKRASDDSSDTRLDSVRNLDEAVHVTRVVLNKHLHAHGAGRVSEVRELQAARVRQRTERRRRLRLTILGGGASNFVLHAKPRRACDRQASDARTASGPASGCSSRRHQLCAELEAHASARDA